MSMTEMALDGIVCISCGEFIASENEGYPRNCEDCTE